MVYKGVAPIYVDKFKATNYWYNHKRDVNFRSNNNNKFKKVSQTDVWFSSSSSSSSSFSPFSLEKQGCDRVVHECLKIFLPCLWTSVGRWSNKMSHETSNRWELVDCHNALFAFALILRKENCSNVLILTDNTTGILIVKQ